LIGRLTGRIVEDAADGSMVIDVGGVGYEVLAPLGTLGRATPDGAGQVTLFIHTHVREDALLLYGFATREDRGAFRSLIAISNIGPKIGVAILSAVTAGELATLISRGEASKLTAIPGVGKKTAERLVLELKDKLIAPPPVAGVLPHPVVGEPAQGPKSALLFGALTRMGFRPAEAERAVLGLGARVETAPLDELVRDALALLAR
jgi:Holliday junction DNA helicase RuvA